MYLGPKSMFSKIFIFWAQSESAGPGLLPSEFLKSPALGTGFITFIYLNRLPSKLSNILIASKTEN